MIVKFNPEKTGIGKFISIFETKLPKVTEEVKALFNTISTLSIPERTEIKNNPIVQSNANLKEYIETVNSAKWSLENFNQWTVQNGQAISKFSVILGKVKSVLLGLVSGLANVAIGFVIGKVIELAGTAIDNYIHKTEKLKEAAQKTADAIDDEEQKLSDVKSELEEINQKIDDLLSKDSLTFVEEQELQNLRDQKALLEDTIRLQREASENKKQDYLDSEEKLYNNQKKKYDTDIDLTSGTGSVEVGKAFMFLSSASDEEISSTYKQVKEAIEQAILDGEDESVIAAANK